MRRVESPQRIEMPNARGSLMRATIRTGDLKSGFGSGDVMAAHVLAPGVI